jgi:SET domain-containing protein
MIVQIPNKIEIRKSPVHGLGVFAKQKIYEGEIIEVCPVINIGLEIGSPSHILIDYRFNYPQNAAPEKTSQVICAGYGMLYNHSNSANANWRSITDINCFEFYATKDIEPEEEIFVWYGDISYWNDGRTHTEVK